MNKKNKTDSLLIIISILTLLISIVGATFAYFSATVMDDNKVKLEAAELSLGFIDNLDGINTQLIPASDEIALYAGTNEDWINQREIKHTDENGVETTVVGNGECYDDNMNEVCSVYTFTFGNSSFTSPMDITAKMTVEINQLSNLYLAVYDETNTQVVVPTKVPTLTGGSVTLKGIEQYLLASSKDANNSQFNPKNPQTYTPLVDKKDPTNKDKNTNVRTYKMVLWVKETGRDQTKEDSNKMFIGSMTIQTANGGVTATFVSSKK